MKLPPKFLTLTLLLMVIPLCAAHSWMNEPLTYNRRFIGSCRGAECDRACPNKRRRGMNNSVSDPAATYRRGETIRVRWLRNNHRGGFTRLALVPVSKMFDHSAHDRLAFFYTCWDSFEIRCDGDFENCGSDQDRRAFGTNVRIPAVYPDGDYVMAYVWYGGLHFKRRTGKFADYFHCSHVRIRGGPVESDARPIYTVGRSRSVRGQTCQTAVDRPRLCKRDDDCLDRRSFFGVPRPFRNGAQPPALTAKVVRDVAGTGELPDLPEESDEPDSRDRPSAPRSASPTPRSSSNDSRSRRKNNRQARLRKCLKRCDRRNPSIRRKRRACRDRCYSNRRNRRARRSRRSRRND